MARGFHMPTAVVAAALTAVVVNVVQFPLIEMAMSNWYEAVRIKPGHDQRALVEKHFGSTQRDVGFHVQLRDLAPGATLTLPPSLELYTNELRGIGAVDRVIRREEASTLDAAVAAQLEPAVAASGEDAEMGPYVIALPTDRPADHLIVIEGPEKMWVVDEGLLAVAREAVGS